jgi:outer membrane receptor protein involved in Fe transport
VDRQLDLNVTYKPDFVKGLPLRADVFNVFNSQVAAAIDEQQMTGDTVSATYGRVLSYTAPRSVKFTASYDVKF